MSALTHALYIEACLNEATLAQGVQIVVPEGVAPGAYTFGGITYTDTKQSQWTASLTGYAVTLSQVGAVGEAIEGTFAILAHNTVTPSATHALSGKSRVCRVPDQVIP